jgi:competence protein ComEC
MRRILHLGFVIITLFFLLGVMIFGGGHTVFVFGTSGSEVNVHFIDVGQGDSILVDSSGLDVLIDGGPNTAGSTVVSYLNEMNITHLGLVVATHMDSDHIGGLISVLSSNVQIDKILINNQSSTSQTYNQFMALSQNHTVIAAQRGQVYILTPTVNLTVFNPTQPRTFSEQNENSVVLKLQAGQTSFLLEGDAGFDAEQTMINAGLNLRCNVLKVGHHGSATATGESFLNAVTPTYAVISCALVNSFGHPAPSTIQRLTNHNIITYGTYTNGTIVTKTDGTTVSFTNSLNQTPIPTPTPQTSSTPTTSTVTASPNQSLNNSSSPTPSATLTQTATSSPNQTTSPTTSNQNSQPIASFTEFLTIIIIIAVILLALIACVIIVKRKLWLTEGI